jgi:hypothetical protein
MFRLMKGVISRTIFKALKILLPLYTFSKCCVVFGNLIYTSLETQIFHVPNCNTSITKKSVINMGIKSYNRLPLELRKSVALNDF